MAIKEIFSKGAVIARYIPSDEWKEGLSFFSNDEDYLQVGTWRYQNGKKLLAHIHNEAPRVIAHTQEVVFIRKGILIATIFDDHDEIIEELEVREGDLLVLLSGGHGYRILADDTEVLEIKNGPYLGAEVDRRRIE